MSQHTPMCSMCEAGTGKHPSGSVSRQEKCGCDVTGYGLLPNPWHVHFCPLHAKAPEMLEMIHRLREIADIMCANNWPDQDYWNVNGEGYEAFMAARALLREIEEEVQ